MTLDDLWALCVGEIGMSAEDYLGSSWREIVCTIHGYYNRVKNQTRVSWEQARMISYHALIAHVKKGSLNNPQDLIRFEWDEVNPDNHFRTDMSQAEKNEYFRVWAMKQKVKHEIKQERKNNSVKNGKPR